MVLEYGASGLLKSPANGRFHPDDGLPSFQNHKNYRII